jgi:hypothetical protein
VLFKDIPARSLQRGVNAMQFAKNGRFLDFVRTAHTVAFSFDSPTILFGACTESMYEAAAAAAARTAWAGDDAAIARETDAAAAAVLSLADDDDNDNADVDKVSGRAVLGGIRKQHMELDVAIDANVVQLHVKGWPGQRVCRIGPFYSLYPSSLVRCGKRGPPALPFGLEPYPGHAPINARSNVGTQFQLRHRDNGAGFLYRGFLCVSRGIWRRPLQ